jgi:hypothetical protein
MISKFRLFAAALAAVLLCCVAGAQRPNASTPARGSANHARPAARASAGSTHSAAMGLRSSRQASGQNTPRSTPAENLFPFDSISDVPGLGFDFPHWAAINGALRSSPLQIGHRGHGAQGSFVPLFFGGYPYDYADSASDQQDQQQDPQTVEQSQPQSQTAVNEQPIPAQQGTDSGSDTGNPSASVSEPQAPEQVPDVGNFIFVRRDGRILFASVFSVVGPQLQYVSPEGIRRTLAISDLDVDATQQMNEARGTTVQIHN